MMINYLPSTRQYDTRPWSRMEARFIYFIWQMDGWLGVSSKKDGGSWLVHSSVRSVHSSYFFSIYAICMYVVWLHICMHVCMYICMYVCMYVCMYACIYVFIYLCIYDICLYVVWLHIWIYVCRYVCMYVCRYVYIYIYVGMYMYVCMYVWK